MKVQLEKLAKKNLIVLIREQEIAVSTLEKEADNLTNKSLD